MPRCSRCVLAAIILSGIALSSVTTAVKAASDNYFEMSGFMAFDLRVFPQEAIHNGQDNQYFNPSLVLQPEFLFEWNDGDDRVEFIPFLRLDSHDSERSHGDIRELSYLHIGDGWDITIGIDKVFWGVIESRHLVDYINQTDMVEDVDGEDKLGQPMINLGLQGEWGDLNVFLMPYFRERTFPGIDGRLRAPSIVDTDRAEYESSRGRQHPDVALRYATVYGDWDIGLAQFHGTGREPRLVPEIRPDGTVVLIPHYDIVDRSSVDVQATIEEWLWKLEAVYEHANYDSFFAVSGGLEYTFFGAVGEAGDLGVLAEYHYDGRNEFAPPTLYDDDIFLGARLSLNDTDDTSLLAGIIYDPDSEAKIISLEAETRLTEFWKLEVEIRLYEDLNEEELLYAIRRDDHLQIRFSRYF